MRGRTDRGACFADVLMNTPNKTMDDKTIEILKHVEGISTSDGLKYCGSDAAYAKFINTYYHSIETKAAEIQDAYDREDFALYTMKVHSLKSTSRIAGASVLSELAYKLEEAGRTGDIAYISANNDDFLRLFRSYSDKLSVLDSLKNDGGKSADPISENDLKDAYHSLEESIAAEDYDAVEMILNEVKKFSLPKSDEGIMNKLEQLLKNMEWDEMTSLVSDKQ